MRDLNYGSFLFFAALLSGLMFFSVPVLSKSLQKDVVTTDETKPIVIKSKSLEINNNQKIVIFTGNVTAVKDAFDIECQKMFVHYETVPAEKEEVGGKTKINRIVSLGQVRIKRSQGGEAFAEKAVYYQKADKIVLTGKPVVKQGNDFVEGDLITIFLKENRSVVESSQDNKVRAIIFPKSEKR